MNNKKYFINLSLFILILSVIVMFSRTTKASYLSFIDSWFIISSLCTAILLFKHILDHGAFDVFRYSWHKTVRYTLFFLPKYWKSEDKDVEDSDDEKVKIDNIYDFVEYRKGKMLKSLPVLLFTSLTHLFLAIGLSLIIYIY